MATTHLTTTGTPGCALFGIDADVAMQVVAIGFVISVVQDSMETALNSSTDILFTAAASAGSSCVVIPSFAHASGLVEIAK